MISVVGRLAQSARASGLHPEGRGFEPLTAHCSAACRLFLRLIGIKAVLADADELSSPFQRNRLTPPLACSATVGRANLTNATEGWSGRRIRARKDDGPDPSGSSPHAFQRCRG
jgi:hypothetical protein